MADDTGTVGTVGDANPPVPYASLDDLARDVAALKDVVGGLSRAVGDLGARVGALETAGSGAVTAAEFGAVKRELACATYIANRWFGAEVADFNREEAAAAARAEGAGSVPGA
jgi:hypothetical protein